MVIHVHMYSSNQFIFMASNIPGFIPTKVLANNLLMIIMIMLAIINLEQVIPH